MQATLQATTCMFKCAQGTHSKCTRHTTHGTQCGVCAKLIFYVNIQHVPTFPPFSNLFMPHQCTSTTLVYKVLITSFFIFYILYAAALRPYATLPIYHITHTLSALLAMRFLPPCCWFPFHAHLILSNSW